MKDFDDDLDEDDLDEDETFNDMSWEKDPYESDEDYEERMEDLNSFMED